MIRLYGADWVTFDGIDAIDGGTSTSDYCEYGYYILSASGTNGNLNNTIKNATITMHRDNTSSIGVYQYCPNPLSAAGTNSYNKYLNLSLSNTRTGIQLSGSTTYHDMNNEIGSTSNDPSFAQRFTVGSGGIDDIGGAYSGTGISVVYQEGVRVHDCDVKNLFTTSSSSIFGIYVNYNFGTNDFYGNRIYGLRETSTSSTGSIYGFCVMGSSDHVRIYNNFISGFTHLRSYENATINMYGLYSNSSATVSFDHNNVSIGSSSGMVTSTNIFISGGTNNIRNNVLVSRTPNQTTGKHYLIYYSTGNNLNSNYNLFYLPYSSNGLVGYYSGEYATLDAWYYNTGKDYNSVVGEPRFVDEANNNLRIQRNVFTPVNNSGTPVSHVPPRCLWRDTQRYDTRYRCGRSRLYFLFSVDRDQDGGR